MSRIFGLGNAGFSRRPRLEVSSMSRPWWCSLAPVIWGLSGSRHPRDTRSGRAPTRIFSVLEKLVMLACGVPR